MFLSYKPGSSVLSMDLTGNYLKLVQGGFKNGKLVVKRVHDEPIDPNLFNDGVIEDKAEFTKFLSSIIKKHKMSSKEVVLTLDCSAVIRRELDIEILPMANVNDLVAFELSRLLPINIEDYSISYKPISNYESSDSKKMQRVLVYAMPNAIVRDLFLCLKEIGLSPSAFDFNDNSLSKFIDFIDLMPKNQFARAFIEIQDNNISVYIFSDNVVKVNRLLQHEFVTNEMVFQRAQTELGSDAQLVIDLFRNETPEAINKLNNEIIRISDISQLEIPEAISNPQIRERGLSSRQAKFIEDVVISKSSIIEEIEKVFRFYTSRSNGNPIENVLVYGKYAQYRDITNKLSNVLNFRFEILDVLSAQNVNLNNDTGKNLLPYVNGLGVMIRDYGKK